MKISDIMNALEAEPLLEDADTTGSVRSIYSTDLMSDLLHFSEPHSLLITGLVNPQVVRSAEMADVRVVVFVNAKRPDSETMELAKKKSIALLTTRLSMYSACGKLYQEAQKWEKKKEK